MIDPTPRRTDIVDTIVDAIEEVAPDVEARSLPADGDLRLDADLDSMDFLAVITLIAERTGADIPERVYGQFRSIDDIADHVAGQVVPPGHPA